MGVKLILQLGRPSVWPIFRARRGHFLVSGTQVFLEVLALILKQYECRTGESKGISSVDQSALTVETFITRASY
jgi:ABC-type branched-subunit amino acid transport system permease subunit